MTLDRVAARTPDGRTLFDNLSLVLARERTGVVGRNGAGKSTLLDLIAGVATPSGGAVARTGTVGRLSQAAAPAPGETVAETLGAAEGRSVIVRILSGRATGRDLEIADWTLDERIGEALSAVGLAGLDLDRPTAGLSGGELTRLRLAGLMLAAPDLLLLDEPTNHLDGEARAIVAGALARWKGGAVVVSHDRALLRRMDRIVELSGLGVAVYGGGWDLYAERKAAEREAAERELDVAERAAGRAAREQQQAVERRARRDRAGRTFAASGSAPKILLGAMARRAEESAGRETRLAERQKADADRALGEARDRVERVRVLDLPMPSTGLAPGRTVLRMDGAAFAVGGRLLAGPVDLTVAGPERIAVQGPNGSGKSTLLKMAAGLLTPTAGRVDRPVTAAFLDQDAALLKPDETLVEAWTRLNPGGTLNEARAALARFLFRSTAADRTAGTLSGGERLRAALACVMTGAAPPQLLILDEPTNHLDLDSVAAVEAALAAYDGALVLVSHDLDLVRAVGAERTVRMA